VSCPDGFCAKVRIGDSIAVDGACLTAVAAAGGRLRFDVSPETVRSVAGFAPGAPANLELALAADARLGGHFVTGHVDGVAAAAEVAEEGDCLRPRFRVSSTLLRYLVPKGCVALAGVSLTVCERFGDGFDVQIVPHTLRSTSLAALRVGSALNVEVDLLAKYVESLGRDGRTPASGEA